MREKLFLFLLILGFGILLVRLFVLQIVRGAYYRQLAEGNRIRLKKLPALRGIVYDRNEEVLLRNTPEGREYIYGPVVSHVLGYIGEVSQEELGDCEDSSNTILISSSESNSRIDSSGSMENIGARIVKTHKIGQTRPQKCTYSPGDLIGKIGIEKEYDWLLRGQEGGILEEFDAQGEKVRELGRREPIPGQNLALTLDLGLQKKAFEIMGEKRGAVVASRPESGEILALVSLPSFDPNVFTIKAKKEIERVLTNKEQPMFNRAIGGLYPPGSTFKIVTAIAGLQEGKIDRETKIEDSGQIKVGRWTYANWYFRQYGKTEGMVDIVKAIKRSNDIFFYRVGERLGIEKLSFWAGQFGFGETTGIDLTGEAKGLLPDKKWKKEVRGENWYLGDDFITAIGQGDLLATPLQVNLMTAVVANGGKWCRPHLMQNAKCKMQNCNSKLKIKGCRDLGIKKESLELVKEGMRQACLRGEKEGERNGTGWPFFQFKIQNEKLKIDNKNFFPAEASGSAEVIRVPVACKTGTAESPGEKSKPHAWFTVFAPVQDPEIVLTVLVENSGEGSSIAGPIAKEILKWWFERKPKDASEVKKAK